MMEGEGRGKRLAATACAFTLLFCLAVGLGVHGAFSNTSRSSRNSGFLRSIA